MILRFLNRHWSTNAAAVLLSALLLPAASLDAVTSKVIRHDTASALQRGEVKNLVVSSRGTLSLGTSAETLLEDFGDVWSINSLVSIGETLYIGTSPNGGVYKYRSGELTRVYPPDPEDVISDDELASGKAKDPNDPNDPNDPGEQVDKSEHLTNEHIFAMSQDVAGRLLVGISGKTCRLCRLEKGILKTIFEPNDATYIFDIITDAKGNICLATGPEGKVYRTDSLGRKPSVIYDSTDKNILSLAAGDDGIIYAGSDTRGLIYRIDPKADKTTVLYDSDQPEITALLYDDDSGQLFAASTSAEIVATQSNFAAQMPSAGRPDTESSESDEQPDEPEPGEPETTAGGGKSLNIANSEKDSRTSSSRRTTPVERVARPARASYVYSITRQGFVTQLFSQVAVFFDLARWDDKLLVGSGNKARLFRVDPATEDEASLFEDENSSQITAIRVIDGHLYIGTANPAKLMKLTGALSGQGTYVSELIDAGQPANWGKLQVDADIPADCNVLVASRSGNVRDVNDPTFSDWSELTELDGPEQMRCPLGRFCQYKLVLSGDGSESPVIRAISVAGTVPNLAPEIQAVGAIRNKAPGKDGMFKIAYKAKDENGDDLVYRVEFRKVGRSGWIELKDDVTAETVDWDSRTVEDGRYEIRITADDRRSNTSSTKLTDSRISDAVVIDNTGPTVKCLEVDAKGTTLTLKVRVEDEFSAIEQLQYTVDSNEDWIGTVPEDLVFDTMQEDFVIVIEDLEPGEHVVAIRAKDAVENLTYRTFEVGTPRK